MVPHPKSPEKSLLDPLSPISLQIVSNPRALGLLRTRFPSDVNLLQHLCCYFYILFCIGVERGSCFEGIT
jgi:hypothetical protein